MAKSVKNYILEQQQEQLVEMSNIHPKRSGLSRVIWISDGIGSRHGPRIKVYAGSPRVTPVTVISISDTPEIKGSNEANISPSELKLISEWIIKNKKVLLGYWNQKGRYADTLDAINALKSV